MIINKVIQGGSALLDLTQDTVNENNLLKNETAHNSEGESIIGTYQGGGGTVNSVNGKTGDVVLNANDVDALPSNTPIPTKTSDLTNDSGYVTASILPIGGTTGQVLAKKSNSDYDMEWVNQSGGGGAVNSVNGKTGTVILDGTDIILTSALPIGGQTKTQVEDSIKALNDVKVDKVAGKGLSAEDYTSASKTKLDGLANIKSIGAGLSLNSSTGELTATGGGGSVTGVKGNAEQTYRIGNVNIDYDDLGIDSELSSVSDLPLKNKAITAALDEKQDDIGIDEEPTAYSEKLVYSGGVDKAIKNISTPFVSYDSMTTTDHTNAGITTGGRNLLNNTLTTGTVDGITFTKNIDSSVTISGTATGSGYETVGSISLGEGTFTVTQAEFDGDKEENLLGDLYVFDGSDNVLAYTSEDHNSFTLQSAATVTVKIKYENTTVYDDKRIYPMVRVGYEVNDNYEPFYTLMPTFNSGERNSTLFSRISALFNNVRKLWNTVGSTAIDTAYGATLTAQLANLKSYNTYSTSETWTGKYWYDGKKIYFKTFYGTLSSGSGHYSFAHNISSISECLDKSGYVKDGTAWVPYGFFHKGPGDVYYYVSCYVTSDNIVLECSNDYGGKNFKITIFYTKTTD